MSPPPCRDGRISAKTIETYKMRSFTKLGLTGRPDVIRYALERGWFEDPVDTVAGG